jgi:hypothetical protein
MRNKILQKSSVPKAIRILPKRVDLIKTTATLTLLKARPN